MVVESFGWVEEEAEVDQMHVVPEVGEVRVAGDVAELLQQVD